MSVLQNPVRVIKTLIVPTVTVLTVVLVNRDSLEMAQYVKVSENVVNNYPTTVAYSTSPEVSILQEVDEKCLYILLLS